MEQNFCSESNAGLMMQWGRKNSGSGQVSKKKKIGSGLGIKKVGCFTQIPDFWYKCNQNYGWFLRNKVGLRVFGYLTTSLCCGVLALDCRVHQSTISLFRNRNFLLLFCATLCFPHAILFNSKQTRAFIIGKIVM